MANKTIKTRLQVKHDTSEHWQIAGSATNPFIPLIGEICFYEDVNKFKIGDGVRNINELPFAGGGDGDRIIDIFPEYNMLYDDLIHDYVYQYKPNEVVMKNLFGRTAGMEIVEGPRVIYLESAESTIVNNSLIISADE